MQFFWVTEVSSVVCNRLFFQQLYLSCGDNGWKTRGSEF